MRDRLIFTWIDDIVQNDLSKVEREFHHIVRTNCFGIGNMTKLYHKINVNTAQTPYFNRINWNHNPELRDWLKETNRLL
jgi:hypothetical protein